jgi:hypothetical protein
VAATRGAERGCWRGARQVLMPPGTDAPTTRCGRSRPRPRPRPGPGPRPRPRAPGRTAPLTLVVLFEHKVLPRLVCLRKPRRHDVAPVDHVAQRLEVLQPHEPQRLLARVAAVVAAAAHRRRPAEQAARQARAGGAQQAAQAGAKARRSRGRALPGGRRRRAGAREGFDDEASSVWTWGCCWGRADEAATPTPHTPHTHRGEPDGDSGWPGAAPARRPLVLLPLRRAPCCCISRAL